MTYLLDTNAISELMRADPRIEKWMAGLREPDRIITCPIVRGEILFGISRLPTGKRRTEHQQSGNRFLNAFACEPVPERAGDLYAAIKLARKSRGLVLDENDLWIAATAVALDATLVSRDQDFEKIDGLAVMEAA